MYHAAGHSPGQVAFHWPERDFVIAGDAVATWPKLAGGWKNFNLNVKQHEESLCSLAALEPKLLGVGHGDPITDDAAGTLHRSPPSRPAPVDRPVHRL